MFSEKNTCYSELKQIHMTVLGLHVHKKQGLLRRNVES